LEPVTDVEDAILKMAAELLLPGLRPHELAILAQLCHFVSERLDDDVPQHWSAGSPIGRSELLDAIRTEFPQSDGSDTQFDSAISVLDYSYFTGPNCNRFGNQPLVEAVNSIGTENGTAYRLNSRFADMLATNRTFRIFFADTLRTGMANCRDIFREAAARQQVFDHMFLYERKYSMADVMRLCGWKKENTPQNVGGYLLDKETNTMPIFVKYAASQYEDEFLSTQEMKYFSKNGRTPQSPEFRWALNGIGPNWGQTHFVPLFVMRKAEEAEGKYYYVGHVAAFDNPQLTTKPDASGQGSVKVTLSILRLARPIDPELYRHLVS
jgi:hypothetical protein